MNHPRYASFEPLRDNWSNLPAPRLALFARSTAHFSQEVVDEAVQIVMVDCHYPPNLKAVMDACRAAERELSKRSRAKRGNERYRPGEPDYNGQPTFTPDEARAELKRLRAEHPDWFVARLPSDPLSHPIGDDARLRAMLDTINRIYVKGLQRCASLDGRAFIHAEQRHLF